MIYIIYEIEKIGPYQAYIENIGNYAGFMFGRFDESLLPYINLIDCLVVPENVAMAYKFAGKTKGNISVRPDTNQYNQLGEDKLVPYKDKFKYYLTDEDRVNAALCDKAIMHAMLNKFYNNKIMISLSTPEIFRENLGWKSIEELVAQKKLMMDKIDACQTMEDTVELLHYHFGIQKNDSSGDFKIDL